MGIISVLGSSPQIDVLLWTCAVPLGMTLIHLVGKLRGWVAP